METTIRSQEKATDKMHMKCYFYDTGKSEQLNTSVPNPLSVSSPNLSLSEFSPAFLHERLHGVTRQANLRDSDGRRSNHTRWLPH